MAIAGLNEAPTMDVEAVAPQPRVLEEEIVYPQLFAVRKSLSPLVSTN